MHAALEYAVYLCLHEVLIGFLYVVGKIAISGSIVRRAFSFAYFSSRIWVVR